jgi:hypothetical protein
MELEISLPCSNSPPMVPILSQINAVPTAPSHLSKIHSVIKILLIRESSWITVLRGVKSCKLVYYGVYS